MHPAEALRYADIKGMRQEAKRSGKPHRTRILRMAYASMKRNKGRTLLAALSLFIATAMLCNIWTQYISYDEAKYMDGMAASDYLLADGSAAVSYTHLDVYKRQIPILQLKRQRPYLYPQQVHFQASPLPHLRQPYRRWPLHSSLCSAEIPLHQQIPDPKHGPMMRNDLQYKV